MKTSKRPALPGSVDLLRKRIELWRHSRKKIAPMPEHLWSAAMALAAEHGICRIARTIRIDYAALKKRLEKMPKQKAPGDPTPQSFIELKSPAFITANPGEAAIEFSDDNGATMSCRLSGRVELDVIALAHAFWNKA